MKFKIIIAIYAAIGILTSGYAANHCTPSYPHVDITCTHSDRVERAMIAWWAWPLYWSWTLQENINHGGDIR